MNQDTNIDVDASLIPLQNATAGSLPQQPFSPQFGSTFVGTLNGQSGNVVLTGGLSGFTWSGGSGVITLISPLTTKGDLYGFGTTGNRLSVGTDGQVLVADAASPLGVKWVTPGAGVGTVTSVSVVSANGLAGTVATATTTPAITLSTTIAGVLKGDGTALSAAASADIITSLGFTPTNAAIVPSTVPAAGRILVGNAGGTAYAPVAMSGDATLANTGALTLASVIVAAGPIGSATVAPIITYDAKGRLTTVSSATITPAVGSITGLGTGVATALAVNVGTDGAFVVKGGVLGSPLSAGTLPAFTLGGTVTGQLNLSYSGSDNLSLTSSTGTNASNLKFVNTGGSSYVGAENSTGGGTATLLTGSTAYALILRPANGKVIQFGKGDGSAVTATFSDTGAVLVGTIAASNFSGTSSGTNTGDQTITLTGAVTGNGTGSFATTIATPGTLTVSSTNSTATAHTHAITSSSAPGATASLLATDSSGIIGLTGTRIVKGWFTDLAVTNAIAGSVTGNAATVTTNANLTGPITSAGNATSIASQTGTGTKFVVDTSPTIVTPVINSAAHVGGTWVADATWTLPALTLGGTVSGTPTWASSQAITLSTAAQPNITSVGTLTSLSVNASATISRTDTGSWNPAIVFGMTTYNQWSLGKPVGANDIAFRNDTSSYIGLQLQNQGTYADALLGSVVSGSPTGGAKGLGTGNFAGDVYKNGTAYTNPHGGFEFAYTGKLKRYGSRMRAMGLVNYRPLSLNDLEAYTRKNYHFPYMGDDQGNGLFSGGERLLLITEELATHLFSMNRRLETLEAKFAGN